MSDLGGYIPITGNKNRVTPDPVDSALPDIHASANVPMVNPATVIPSNLKNYGMLSSLSEALKLGALTLPSQRHGGAGSAKSAKEEEENNKQFSAGMVEATARAAKTRDTFTELTNNGTVTPNKNPFYQLGLQTGSYQGLAAQYRQELIQARQDSPNADPGAVQDAIKQKYLPLLQQGRPEVVLKHFIEPSKAADEDDIKLYNQSQSDLMKNQVSSAASSSVGATLSGDLALYHQRNPKGMPNLWPAEVQDHAKKAFEAQLANLSATGMPTQEATKAMVNSVVESARGEESLSDQMMVLDTLKKIKTVDGKNVLDDPSYGKIYNDERQKLKSEWLSNKKTEAEAENAVAAQATRERVQVMMNDLHDHKVQDISAYIVKDPRVGGLDYNTIGETYKWMKSFSTTQPELSTNSNAVEMREAGKTLDPVTYQKVYHNVAKANPELRDSYISGLGDSIQAQKQAKSDAKLRDWDTGVINKITGALSAHVGIQQTHWVHQNSSSQTDLQRKVNSGLSLKYRNKLLGEIDDWVQQQSVKPNSAQIENYAHAVWARKYKPQADRDIQNIHDLRGNLDDILNDRTTAPSPTAQRQRVQAQVKPAGGGYNSNTHRQKYPWAISPELFKKESDEYIYHKRGPIYDFLKASLGSHAKPDLLEAQWHKKGPAQILEALKRAGYPTFLDSGNH